MYLDGENSRKDGASDANGPAISDKLEEGVCPEEQLGYDEVCSSIHLLLQMSQVMSVALCFRVTSWVA